MAAGKKSKDVGGRKSVLHCSGAAGGSNGNRAADELGCRVFFKKKKKESGRLLSSLVVESIVRVGLEPPSGLDPGSAG